MGWSLPPTKTAVSEPSKPFATLLGNGLGDLGAINRYAQQNGLALRMVPECTLAGMDAGHVRTERRDGFDYILALDSMLDPQTPELCRNHQRALDYQSRNAGARIRAVALSSDDARTAPMAIDSAWHAGRNGNGDATSGWERQAFLRCLAQYANFHLTTLLAEADDGSPLGFTINEAIDDGYYMAHFGETLLGHAGLSEWLELATARHMQTSGCRWMNFQEDHGNAGLRRMKQSWNPARLLRVYDVAASG